MVDDKSVMAVIRAARPSFRNKHDKAAFAVHASFLSSGYVLIATGSSSFSDDSFSSSSPVEEVGIDNWNAMVDEYAFVYTNPDDKGRKVLVKCLAMNHNLMVDVLPHGSSEPLHCEIDVEDCIAESNGENYSSHYKNMSKLVASLNESILSKLGSDNRKREPSEERVSSSGTWVEDADNTVHIVPPIEPSGLAIPPLYPAGGGDLFPGPGAGMFPSRGGFGGGMLVGPNDPRWGNVGGLRFPGNIPGVIPGARFDPYGPPGLPGFQPNRFARGPGQRFHPDLEQPGPDHDFI